MTMTEAMVRNSLRVLPRYVRHGPSFYSPLVGHSTWTRAMEVGEDATDPPWDTGDTGPAADSTNFKTGDKGIKFTQSGAGNVFGRYTHSSAIDLSIGFFSAWYYLEQNVSAMQIQLWDTSNNFTSAETLDATAGWHSTGIMCSDNFDAGSVDFSIIDGFSFVMTGNDTDWFTVDSIHWHVPAATPTAVVMFRFDDWLDDHSSTALTKLDALGYKGMFAFIGDTLSKFEAGFSGVTGAATIDQALAAIRNGHTFALHGWASGGLTGTDAAKLAEIQMVQHWAYSMGMDNPGLRVLVVPGGGTGMSQTLMDSLWPTVDQIYSQRSHDAYLYGTSLAGGGSPPGLAPLPPDRRIMYNATWDNSTTTGLLLNATWTGAASNSPLATCPVVDNAITRGRMLTVACHQLDGSGSGATKKLTAIEFGHLLDYIESKRAAGDMVVADPVDFMPGRIFR